MYCKAGDLQTDRHVFDGMPAKDLDSWNALFAGYARLLYEVMGLFRDMRMVYGMSPSEATIVLWFEIVRGSDCCVQVALSLQFRTRIKQNLQAALEALTLAVQLGSRNLFYMEIQFLLFNYLQGPHCFFIISRPFD